MPYKNPEDRKAYYQANKDNWKNPDGSWKKPSKSREEINQRNRENYHSYYKGRHNELRKKYQDAKRVSGNCLICKKFFKTLCRDHCHTTNIERGYICMHCNFVLGHAFDNVEILKETIAYLEKFNDRIK